MQWNDNDENNEEIAETASDSPVLYADFHWRMLASVIDTLLSSLLFIPLYFVAQDIFAVITPEQLEGLSQQELQALLIEALKRQMSHFLIAGVVVLIFWFAKDGTPGKMILKMRIVDAKTLEKASITKLIIRFFAYIISLMPFGMGFIWIHLDKKKHRGWHDIISGTVVIRMPFLKKT